MMLYNDEVRVEVCPDCQGTGVICDPRISGTTIIEVSYIKCPSCEGTGYKRRPLTNLDFLNAISVDPAATAQFLVEWCQEKAWRKDAGAVEAWLLEPRYKDGSIHEPR